MFKFFLNLIFLFFLIFNRAFGDIGFNEWKIKFKIRAINSGVSEKVVNEIMADATFLPKVIEYDRFQPEFYEDTFTYIKKRSSKNKVREGLKIYKKNKNIIEIVEKEFQVEKELLLALMGIETNFGKYLGKMDIVSSLATLSYDKRRSEFFSKELLILLKLVDNNIIDRKILYGSWAGAFGNFQFMPRTIRNYAIDYNNNKTIELKNIEDSFASAANYLKTIGWKKNQPCFFKIELKDNIPKKYLNSSARNIKNKSYKYMKNIRIKDIFIDKDKLQLNRYITLELCLQSVDKTLSDEDINKAINNITQDIKKIYKLNIQEAQ